MIDVYEYVHIKLYILCLWTSSSAFNIIIPQHLVSRLATQVFNTTVPSGPGFLTSPLTDHSQYEWGGTPLLLLV